MSSVDFVITWVDGNDPKWQEEKKKYEIAEKGDSRDSRYRDWDNLRYWFRGVEKYSPWVNNVFFVTYGHYPEWLNLDHPKLKLVKHSDFIPKEFLPTFSCRPIEFNLHRIPGLSEQFVYFNDDMFLINTVKETDFFSDNLPCDSAILDAASMTTRGKNNERIPTEALYATLMYNVAVINGHFSKNEVIKNNWRNWFAPCYGSAMIRTLLLLPWSDFTGFKNLHLPYSYLKKSFETVWQQEKEALTLACSHRFRNSSDVSSRLISYWQLAEGEFTPRSFKIGRLFYINDDGENNEKVFRTIRDQSYKMICINDEYSGDSFETVKNSLNSAFEAILPEKSRFEIG